MRAHGNASQHVRSASHNEALQRQFQGRQHLSTADKPCLQLWQTRFVCILMNLGSARVCILKRFVKHKSRQTLSSMQICLQFRRSGGEGPRHSEAARDYADKVCLQIQTRKSISKDKVCLKCRQTFSRPEMGRSKALKSGAILQTNFVYKCRQWVRVLQARFV